jgi:hypothetical protein
MEPQNSFEELLRKNMQADAEEPSLSLVEEARRKVMLRKKNAVVESGVFVLPRWLFNFRISFYHALVLVLLLETGAIYQTHRAGAGHGREASSGVHSDISSALSSTILPGTTTYLRQ